MDVQCVYGMAINISEHVLNVCIDYNMSRFTSGVLMCLESVINTAFKCHQKKKKRKTHCGIRPNR